MGTITPGGSGIGSPAKLVHEFSWEPRYRQIPTVNGGVVVQHLGYVRRKIVSIIWDTVPADTEAAIVAEETGGYARFGPITWDFPAGRMVGLYNAQATLIKFSESGS